MKSSEPIEDLMRAHGPFLHRLAHALTADGAAAEDLVSDTWLAALRPGLGRLRNERGWLATVLRRRAAAQRGKATALPLDEEVLPPGREPGPEDVAVRMEREQLVNRALAQLKEPYRSVLFLRYHDGLSPGAIARQVGAPHDTVRTQLSRGLEHLRRSLDREMTGRGAADPRAEWLGALLPLALRPGAPAAAPAMAMITMKMLSTLGFAVLVIAALGAWAAGFFGTEVSGESLPSPSVAMLEEPAETAAIEPLGPDRDDATGAPEIDRESGAQSRSAIELTQEAPVDVAADSEEAAIEGEPVLLGVAGTVAIMDGPSVHPSSLDGELEMTFWGEKFGISMEVKVVDGAFRAEFERMADGGLRLVGAENTIDAEVVPNRVSIKAATFPAVGQTYVVDGEHGKAIGNGLDVETQVGFGEDDVKVWLKRAPQTRLEVVDRATGAALSGVEVLGLRGSAYRSGHPQGSSTESLTAETDSPVTLSASGTFVQSGEVTALVGAQGYAWAKVNLDLQAGAERRVELEPGGRLTATVDGAVPKGANLRLYRVDSLQQISEVRLARTNEAVWDGLLPGDYRAQVEVGASYRSPKVLATQDVVVEAGGEATLTLLPEAVVAAARARASGVLFLPEGWPTESLGARVELLGPSTDGSNQWEYLGKTDFHPVDGVPRAYSFQLPELEVGRYVFELREPIVWKALYDLPQGGSDSLRFEVPEPVQITVQVVDAGTGEPLSIDRMSWNPARPPESLGGSSCPADDPIATGLFQFRVTRGPIHLSVFSADKGFASKNVEAEEGAEFTLEVERRMRVFVTLLDGEAKVPRSRSTDYVVESVDGGEGFMNAWGTVDGRDYFGVSEPGRYRLTIPEINGYHLPSPVEFDVRKGEDTEVEVQLTSR